MNSLVGAVSFEFTYLGEYEAKFETALDWEAGELWSTD
jgi:hypothetical protein